LNTTLDHDELEPPAALRLVHERLRCGRVERRVEEGRVHDVDPIAPSAG
jgi:hypothetical protein